MAKNNAVRADEKWLARAQARGFLTEKQMLEYDLSRHPTCKVLGEYYGCCPDNARHRLDKWGIPRRPTRVNFGMFVCPFCGVTATKKSIQQITCGSKACIKAKQREYQRERRKTAQAKEEAVVARKQVKAMWPRACYVNLTGRARILPAYREVGVSTTARL